MAGGKALAEGYGDLLEAEAFGELAGDILVLGVLDLAGGDFGPLDMEDALGVLFVGDADIDEFHEATHHLAGFLAGPEFLAVVEVGGNGEAVPFGGLAGFAGDTRRRSR